MTDSISGDESFSVRAMARPTLGGGQGGMWKDATFRYGSIIDRDVWNADRRVADKRRRRKPSLGWQAVLLAFVLAAVSMLLPGAAASSASTVTEEDPYILNQYWGYGVVLGFGVGLTIITQILIKIDRMVYNTKQTAEEVYSAGRNNTAGLTAAVIVSQWTWTATILESSNAAWKYGVAGPFWYAAGATIHIMLFAIVAIEVKRKAPNMHTVTEFMLVRHGRFAHFTFFCFAIMANIIVSAMLILGGASTVHNLTGMSEDVCMFIIPACILVYTTSGGLKATFFACYLNSIFIFIVLLYFVVSTYFVSEKIGSTKIMYDMMVAVSSLPDEELNNNYPPGEENTRTVDGLELLDGNHGRSFLTLASVGAMQYGIINILGNFGTVFVDQSYWQSAIGAADDATVGGFLLAGIAWFPIPFVMSTSIGLSCRALQLDITLEQANEGLVPAVAVSNMLGATGSVLLLIILFLATTSTGSAELISVSSLVTYDVFLEYIPAGRMLRRNLTLTSRAAWNDANNHAPYPDRLKRKHDFYQRQLLRVTRIITLGYAAAMGFLGQILKRSGVDLSWLYLSAGIWLGSPVIPIVISFFWSKARGIWCSIGSIAGFVASTVLWVTYAEVNYGQITVQTLGEIDCLLAANVASLSLGGIISVVGSLIFPDNFRWQKTIDGIKSTEDTEDELTAAVKLLDQAKFLASQAKKSQTQGTVWTIVFLVVPFAFYASNYVFSEGFFEAWIMISIAWSVTGAYIGIMLPIVEEIKKAMKTRIKRKKEAGELESLVKKKKKKKGPVEYIPATNEGLILPLRVLSWPGKAIHMFFKQGDKLRDDETDLETKFRQIIYIQTFMGFCSIVFDVYGHSISPLDDDFSHTNYGIALNCGIGLILIDYWVLNLVYYKSWGKIKLHWTLTYIAFFFGIEWTGMSMVKKNFDDGKKEDGISASYFFGAICAWFLVVFAYTYFVARQPRVLYE